MTASTSSARAAAISAARDLAARHGWDNVRMGQIADAAGYSRQTLYNIFGGKAGLADALVAAEVDRLLAGVAQQLHTSDEISTAAASAVTWLLAEAKENPLVATVIAGRRRADGLLPYLTTRPESVHEAATALLLDWAATRAPHARDPAYAADTIIRLTLSYLVAPPDTDIPPRIGALAQHLLSA